MTPTRYNDNTWYILVALFNQDSKTFDLYINDGQYVSYSNSSYIPQLFIINIAKNPQLGYWRNPGYVDQSFFGDSDQNSIGDMLFFDGILTTSQINSKAFWMADRLGIIWTDI